jgi:purine-binding chemotaxis protein CheW
MNTETGREVLVFLLDSEEYGVDILRVQEIRNYEKVTPIPGAPPHLKGVVNLRGAIVPIIDLRVRFGRAEPRYDDLTVVVILQVEGRTVGMVVDGVADVVRLLPAEIRPAPSLGSLIGGSFLLEVAVQDDRMILLVDLERMLATRELDALPQLRATAAA